MKLKKGLAESVKEFKATEDFLDTEKVEKEDKATVDVVTKDAIENHNKVKEIIATEKEKVMDPRLAELEKATATEEKRLQGEKETKPENDYTKQPKLKEGIEEDRKDVTHKFAEALRGVKKAISDWSAVFEIDDFAYDVCNDLFAEHKLDELFCKSLDEYDPFIDNVLENIDDVDLRENTVDVKDRKELATLIENAKKENKTFKISRSVKEGFRYTFTATKKVEVLNEDAKYRDENEGEEFASKLDKFDCGDVCRAFKWAVSAEHITKDGVEAVLNKLNNWGAKPTEESCKTEGCKKLTEEPILEPRFDARQSFYGKAFIDNEEEGKVLTSYNTRVAIITKDGKVKLLPAWNSSQTTLRHVKEFLKQNGFKADSMAQMKKDYITESKCCEEENKVCPKCGKELKPGEKPCKDCCDEKEKLTEKHWKHTLKTGNALKDAIEDGDTERVRSALLDCYKELFDNKFIDEDDYESWTEEVRDADFEDKDNADYELDEFYDLCDNISVWIFESLKEDKVNDSARKYIYQFPELKEEDIDALKNFNLEYLGKISEDGYQPGDYVVAGKLDDLKSYGNEHLGGYELHPDYIYKLEDFDTDVLIKESLKEDKSVNVNIQGDMNVSTGDVEVEKKKCCGKHHHEEDEKKEPIFEPDMKEAVDDIKSEDDVIINEENKGLNEDVKIITDLSEYKPWSGAVETWEKIEQAGKVDELDFFLEDLYPEGIGMTALNDLLWFDADYVLDMLGLSEESAEKDED